MYKKITLSITLIICIFLQINATVTISNSKVMDVTIYRNYAKETRVGSATIPEGNSEIVITNITNLIDENSIQVGSKGSNIKILSVSTRLNYLTEPNKNANPTKVKIWEDSIKLLQKIIAYKLKQKEVYENNLSLLNENRKLGNEHEGLKPDLLKQLVELNFIKQLEFKKLIFDIDQEYYETNNTISTLQSQIYQCSGNGSTKTIREIVLKVNAKAATTAQFKASYIVTSASWTPTYEIRCDNTTKPLQLACRAKIVQNTGYDWKDVKIKLSTANPNQNHNRPILYPVYVDFFQPDYYQYKLKKVAAAKEYKADEKVEEVNDKSQLQNMAYISAPTSTENYISSEDFDDGIQVKDNNVTIAEGEMMVEYDIETLQDIESDGKEHIIGIQEITMPATYNYQAVPKLDASAFLLARVADWGKYNLLAGEATIFFDDMYVGKSYLNPNVSADTLLISLGKDDKINIKRIKLNDFCLTKILSHKKRETKAFETTVKNNKNYAIEIEILDQYPISRNSEIEVSLDEAKEAQITKEYGKLAWKIKLQPGESKKLRFDYTIKYDETKTIVEKN
jgi:uncharacterized protein (TIGR02231 family)